MTKRKTMMQEVFDRVVVYGGLPVRYGTVFRYLEDVAKATGEKNWMAIRDAGLMGFQSSERLRPYELPEDVEPLTYDEFKQVVDLPSGASVPEHIYRKMMTMYPKSVHENVSIAARTVHTPRKRVARKIKSTSRTTGGVRGLRK